MKIGTLFPDDDADKARARNTDPSTSHAAANSISSEKIRESQAIILAALLANGPMCDDAIYAAIGGVMSPSGARTRRSELVDKAQVKNSGIRVKLPSGRMSIVWEAT